MSTNFELYEQQQQQRKADYQGGGMSRPVSANRILQLDAEFDQHLASMKKFILDLKDRKLKQLCAVWIKKMCDVSENENVIPKHVRNSYSSRLLEILKNNETFEPPFDEKPPHGPLMPLEEAISRNYYQFNEQQPNYGNHHNGNNNRSSIEVITLKADSDENYENYDSSNQEIIYQYNQSTKFLNKENNEERQTKISYEQQMKHTEAKFKEERLNIQQQHSNEIQQILDRKNNEIDSLKASFGKKRKEYEDNIESLIKKIHHLKNDATIERDGYEKQLNDLKLKIESSIDKKQQDNEKRLNEIVNKYEREKLDLQKQHTKVFQDLVDETNIRLKKVETEFNEQLTINDKVILELENKTQLLKNEIEKNIHVIGLLEKQSSDKELYAKSLEKKLNEALHKNSNLEGDMAKLKESHKRELNEIGGKLDSIASSKNREYESAIRRVNQLKDDLKNSKIENEKTIERLNKTIKDKEVALANANGTIKAQKVKAEIALGELKKEIETKSMKLYDDMRDQMNKCEQDLERSKASRDKQAKEFAKLVDELKQEHRKEIERIDKEKGALRQELENEKQKLIRYHQSQSDQMQSQYQQQIMEQNMASKARVDELMKVKGALESKVIQLEKDIMEANALRKQQITELGVLREDEKNRMGRTFEKELDSLRAKHEHEVKCLRQKVKEQRDELEAEIRMLIKQSDERCRKYADKNAELERSVKCLEAECKRLRECFDKEKSEFCARVDDEKMALKKCYQSQINNLEKELDKEANKHRSFEKRLKSTNSEYEQYVTNLKMQYEEKLKGLMPMALKRDLEETICSLKAQIDSLQKRTALLQSELDDRNQLVNSSSYSASL